MKNKSDIRKVFAAVDGKSFSQAIALRGMADIRSELSKRSRSARIRQIQTAKSYKKIFAPFREAIGQDRKAMQGLKELQRQAKIDDRRFPRPGRLPKSPAVEPQIRSGSLMRVFGPPYDFAWTDKSSPILIARGGPPVRARKDVGEFLAYSDPYGNSVGSFSEWTAAGVGMFFRPISTNEWVRFSPLIKYSYAWRDRSQGGFTAHSSGYLGIRVVSTDLRGGDMTIETDPRYEIWNDGTGWWETHSDSVDWSFFQNQQIFFHATSDRNYFLWIWGYTHADDDGDEGFGTGSWARGWLDSVVPFAVTEEYT
jgi:hypothetical protein